MILLLPYSYLSCRANPTNHKNYKFAEIRNIQYRDIRQIGNEDNEEDNIRSLSVKQLKDICIACDLLRNSLKEDLIACIIAYFESIMHDSSNSLEYLNKIIDDDK